MIDSIWMDKELDQFHADHEGSKDMKLLVDFDQASISFEGTGVIDFGKPKMKKKLTASKFIPPKKGSKGSLF